MNIPLLQRAFLICALSVLHGCMALDTAKSAGRNAKEGNYGAALFQGTIGVAAMAVVDVITLGGLMSPEQMQQGASAVVNDKNANLGTYYTAALSDKSGMSATTSGSGEENNDSSAKGYPETNPAPADGMGQHPTSTGASRATSANPSSGRNSNQALSQNAIANSNCPKSLAHLSMALPDYNNPKLHQARETLLREDMVVVYKKGLASGLTPKQMVLQTQEQARYALSEQNNAKQCVKGASISSTTVIKQLESGTYRFSNNPGISEECANAYVLHYYQAVANKEAAVIIACMATK